MDKDKVLAFAREAGFIAASAGWADSEWFDRIERFAALVAAAEREECAAIAETHAIDREDEYVCDKIAAAIRARGQA